MGIYVRHPIGAVPICDLLPAYGDFQPQHIQHSRKLVEADFYALTLNSVYLFSAHACALGEFVLGQAKFPSPGGKSGIEFVRFHPYIVRDTAHIVKPFLS